MTDGTHRGALIDRDAEKLSEADRLLAEHATLTDAAKVAQARCTELLAEANAKGAEAQRLIAEVKAAMSDRRSSDPEKT